MLPDLKLSDDYLLGNKDFFESKLDFESIEREVDSFVNGIKQRMPLANRWPFINEQQRQCVDHFRSVGMLKFYKDKHDDLDGAARAIQLAIERRTVSMLMQPDLGVEFVDRALAEMVRLDGPPAGLRQGARRTSAKRNVFATGAHGFSE